MDSEVVWCCWCWNGDHSSNEFCPTDVPWFGSDDELDIGQPRAPPTSTDSFSEVEKFFKFASAWFIIFRLSRYLFWKSIQSYAVYINWIIFWLKSVSVQWCWWGSPAVRNRNQHLSVRYCLHSNQEEDLKWSASPTPTLGAPSLLLLPLFFKFN